MKRKILILCVCLLCSSLFAVPAKPVKQTIITEQGEEIVVVLKGDEFFHWFETENGLRYIRNNDSYQEISSEIIQTKVLSQRAKRMTLQPKTMKKIEGTRRQLLLLIEYKDVHFRSYTNGVKVIFDSLLNGSNYTYNGNYGSVKQFYLDNSNHQFVMHSDPIGPVRLSQNRSYYGGNNIDGDDVRPQQMVREALDSLYVQGFDFSPYGVDGTVPSIHVIFAAYGEEAGASTDAIWSHQWSLNSLRVTYNGVLLNTYSCSPELDGNSGSTITNVGVICHELGHTIGLPDFYDTDYNLNGYGKGLGAWSTMASGSWNNGGTHPPFFNAEERAMLGWHTPTVLSSSYQELYLDPLNEEIRSYRIDTKTENEYFLFEARTQRSWDTYIPASGMLIYHADKSSVCSQRWINNTVNANASHECFRIKEANSYSIGGIGAVWPQSGKTEFTDASVPDAKSWAGENTGIPVENIRKQNDTVFFSVGFLQTYSVNATLKTDGGRISPDLENTVGERDSLRFTIASDEHYTIDSVWINDIFYDIINQSNWAYTFYNVRGDSTLTVSFRKVFKILAMHLPANRGQITPSGDVPVDSGQSQTFFVEANSGSIIDRVIINNIRVIPVQDYTYTYTFENVLGDSTFSVFFTSDTLEEYCRIYAKAAIGGVIDPSDTVYVRTGESQTFQITANTGYTIDTIIINNSLYLVSGQVTEQYTFENVRGDSSIYVAFKSLSSDLMEKSQNEIAIYPNPVKDFLYIHSDSPFHKIELLTLSGQFLVNQTFAQGMKSHTIDVRNYPKGFIIINLYTQEGRISRKVKID